MRLATNCILAALVAFALFVAYEETRFQLHSDTATGVVTSVDKKFVGFDESQTTGTTPNYQTTSHYMFVVDDQTYRGKYKVMSRNVGESIAVQYIIDDPDDNRALSSSVESALLILISAVAFFGIFAARRALRSNPNAG